MARNRRNKFQKDSPPDEMNAGRKAPDTPRPRRNRKIFTCPGCGTHTYGDMAYCTDCGYRLSRECPNCGTQWRYEYTYAFCPGCGGQVDSSRQPAGVAAGCNEAAASPAGGGRS